jgi:hypothetical protein
LSIEYEYESKRGLLVDNTSSPWHDGYKVLGEIEDGVAGGQYS